MDTQNLLTNAHDRFESNGFSEDYVTTPIEPLPRDFLVRERNRAGDRPRGTELSVQTEFQSNRVSFECGTVEKQSKKHELRVDCGELFRLSVVFGV